jgi:hypothetical protein
MKWQDPFLLAYDVLDDLGATYILSGNEGEIKVLPWNKGEAMKIVRITNELAEPKMEGK